MSSLTCSCAEASEASGAACGRDPDVLFPLAESVRSGERTPGEVLALRVCQRCPVLARCRAEVLTLQLPYGVAGGLTAADRRAVRAARAGFIPPGEAPDPASVTDTAPLPAAGSGLVGSAA